MRKVTSWIVGGVVAGALFYTHISVGKGDTDVKIIDLQKADLSTAKFSTVNDESFMKSTTGPIEATALDKYTSADKKLQVGLSAYKKVTLELSDWPADEAMFILEGSVEITDAAGHSHIYKAGDAFLMPKGFKGTWRQLSDIKKVHVVYDSK